MMDVDMEDSTQPSSMSQGSSNNRKYSPNFVVVDDAHPFDLDSYISSYTGRTAIDRLTRIVSVCPSLTVDAFNLAVQYIHQSRDPSQYQTLCHAYEAVSSYTGVVGQLPSISELPALDTRWVDEIQRKNQQEKMKLEAELKTYSNNMIKESIRMGHRDLAEFYRTVGDYPAALKHWTKSREFCTTGQHVLDGCISILELLIEQRNYAHLPTYIFKAESALEGATAALQSAKDKESAATGTATNKKSTATLPDIDVLRSKLDFANGLAHLYSGSYERAAYFFLRLNSGTGSSGGLGDWFGKLVSPGDIAIYGSVCALASLSRSAFKAQVLENLSFSTYIEQESHVREMIEAYMASNFKTVLEALNKYHTRHAIDIHLAQHISALHNLTRSRLVTLYFTPFSNIKLDRMAEAFGWSVEETEEYVVSLIRSGDIKGRVDSRSKVLQVRKVDLRAELFAKAIKTGLEMQKTNKKLLYRMKLQQADLIIKGPARSNTGQGELVDQ
ncbi:cop9 signalosome complex subunit 1 [Moniliophthora roreri MCA 2997]|uniref:Cop9 signalosome complex subunit 1 n=2 Tax=Moniliophthora roreri TaxID=221103 RepID=V2XFD8_MONRO|nr:cop9 signalosome complex subunit 1 [Moniliophthora roreri MCA 2997]